MENRLDPTLVYILSIISFLCCCFGGFGILLAAPAFIIANNKLKEAQANPENYEVSSITSMKSAKTIALIALIVNALYLLYTIYTLATTDMEVLMEQQRQLLEQYGYGE